MRPRPFIYIFPLSSSSISCLCLPVLCLMPIVHFVPVSVFTICLVLVRFFFILWVLLRLDYKRMIQHFPSLANACVYLENKNLTKKNNKIFYLTIQSLFNCKSTLKIIVIIIYCIYNKKEIYFPPIYIQ
jgi:hypothetical protein